MIPIQYLVDIYCISVTLHCLDEHFIIALLCMDEKRGDSSFARKGMLMFSNQQDGTSYHLLDLIVDSINVITSITVLWYCYNQWFFERFFDFVVTTGSGFLNVTFY